MKKNNCQKKKNVRLPGGEKKREKKGEKTSTMKKRKKKGPTPREKLRLPKKISCP